MVLRAKNAGVNWTELSPDLSTKDQFQGEVVFSIVLSDVRMGLTRAGTNDGKVWYTKDAGKNWNDVAKNITGLPA
jgi:photosystem II stability/assembly factor-like uncharacterized protein